MIFDWLQRMIERAQAPAESNVQVEEAIETSEGIGRGGIDYVVHDIRTIANPWRVDKHGKRWSVKAGRRKWSAIDQVVYHQTAAVCGERPARYATLGAHYGIPASGALIHVYDEEWLIWHANNLSQRSIGIEIDGRFYGIAGDIKTIWDDPKTKIREQPTELTDAQVTTALAIGRAAANRIKAAGTKFRGFYCHRQSSSSRRNDPGVEPYQRIVQVLNGEYGTETASFVTGDGRPVPREWDPRSKTSY